MLEVDVPGGERFRLAHLVLDFNGTLACGGTLLPGVAERLEALSRALEIHVVTADTFGTVREALRSLPCSVAVLPREGQAEAKAELVERLGPEGCACVGNGRNDRLMLGRAALGIAVVEAEGAAVETVLAARVVVTGIADALDLLLDTRRLVATLRS